MDNNERIRSHLVSVWRESKGFLSLGGKEGMLILTDKHLMFIHKTEAKPRWWQAIRYRQVVNLLKSKNTMITHDGYNEDNLMEDLENEKNIELSFDEILDIFYEEKDWGSVLFLKYNKGGKMHTYQYAVAQDWVKYPMKEPTKYMKVDWAPFVKFVKNGQRITK